MQMKGREQKNKSTPFSWAELWTHVAHVQPATHTMTGGVITHLMAGGSGSHRLGAGFCNLCPLHWARMILHNVKYWGLHTRYLKKKKYLGREGRTRSRNYKKDARSSWMTENLRKHLVTAFNLLKLNPFLDLLPSAGSTAAGQKALIYQYKSQIYPCLLFSKLIL